MVRTTAKAALVLFMVFAFISPALAGVAGKFTAVDGRVDVLKPGEKRAAPVSTGASVSEGDIVRTKSGSFAEITFDDGTVLKLTQSTRIEIKEYLLEGGKRKNGALKLLRGKVRATVSKGLGRVIPVIYSGPSTFRIETPTAVAGVKGTDFFVFHNMGLTGVFVVEGAVDTMGLETPGHVVRVRGGEYSMVERNRPATAAASAREFVMSRHVRDARPSRERHDDKDRSSNRYDKERDGRVKEAGYSEDRGRDRDERELRDRDRSEREFRERDSDREYSALNRDYDRDWDSGDSEYRDDDRYEGDHHDHDYDRPISEINTALLSGGFKGDFAGSAASLSITAGMEGRFRDDHTWVAELDGYFRNGGADNSFTGTLSGTTAAGPMSGTIVQGTWSGNSWSADVVGTMPGGSFSGTFSGSHDSSVDGDINGIGSGTWTNTTAIN